MLELNLSIVPPSVNQIWINKPKGRYKSKKGKEFEKIAKYQLKQQYEGEILTEKLKIKIWLYFKTKAKRDIDNYNKAILDSMTGIIYKDDVLIEELNIKKTIGCGFNKVEIEVEEIE